MPINTVPGSWAADDVLEVTAINRTGSARAVGDIVAFDLLGSDGDVSDHGTNQVDPFSNVIAPATAHLKGWVFGVVTSLLTGEGADNTQIRVGVRGVFDCAIVGSSLEAGDTVAPANGLDTLAKGTDGVTAVGILLEAGGAQEELHPVLFNGDVRNGAAGSASN